MPVFSLKMAQKLPVCDQIIFFKSYLFLTNFDFVAFFRLKMAENGPKNDLIKKNILL